MLSASRNKPISLRATPLTRSNPSGRSAFLFGLSLTLGITFLTNLMGCAAPILALGSSATTAASSVGTATISAAAANPSTAASALSTVTTGKSPLEHAASAATKQNCNFLNALGPKPICENIPVPPVKDMSEPYPGPADTLPTSK